MSIRIDALPTVASAQMSDVLPIMRAGTSNKLTVGQVLDSIVAGAPAALDTLDELAAALNDNSNFAGTITTSLAAKLNTSQLDTDAAFAANSDSKLPSQKAVRTAIAGKLDAVQTPATLASAATVDLGLAGSWNVQITGTTTITSFGVAPAGTLRLVRMASSLTLTHNSTSLILPGASNIVTQPGDVGFFMSEGSGNWRCYAYTPSLQAAYEQGSFTPTLMFGAGSTGMAYGGQVGRYTKVGRIVHVEGSITLTAKGTSTGTALLTGLPYPIAVNSPANIVALSNFSALVAGLQGVFTAAQSFINLRVGNSGGTTGATDANFTNTSVLYFSGSYSI